MVREDTFQKRLEDLRRTRAHPVGRKSGDLLNSQWAVDDLRERLTVGLYYNDGGDFDPTYRDYQATRYYSMTVTPDKGPANPVPEGQWMVVQITKYDLGRWSGMTFPEQNKWLERLWLRHGGT